MENMLAFRARIEGGWALISRPGFSEFLFFRYVKTLAIPGHWQHRSVKPDVPGDQGYGARLTCSVDDDKSMMIS
uniref:Uncharacterized protein n=1 Tax=Candidatus Kentrum sp. LPFa TaxID=2126335 RepID=A0A450W2S7_9GAMM|nr:MAG: hypothetical protein BECKLPF1236A_GA0070988_1005020 [Candidatus Kentron sp. LPFa]VFK27573.1 MAG: hypothetical protein BECKLPF1236C_GA0070990_1004820 [Candidatus Kentron sp. LPFa]